MKGSFVLILQFGVMWIVGNQRTEAFLAARKVRHHNVQNLLQSTTTEDTLIVDNEVATASQNGDLEIIPPNGSFRDTKVGDISIASMNVLAPSYHALEQPEEEREQYAALDRQSRYVKAISMAKRTNADILCLQEVEGGNEELNELLGSCLASQEVDSTKSYDGFVFSPLLPNRKQDIVGLCVAWKTDRHRLVSCETFRRGMVVQLAEQSTGATVAIANLHLPAKPSAVEGRLRSMASAIRRIQTCEATSAKRKRSALDGLAVVLGDFNCGHNAPPVKLLKTGYSTYGSVRDRNYKAKISKRVASNMRHVFRFQDVYEGDLRYSIAPVTVSLHGRGPGSMDHILFSASGDPRQKKAGPVKQRVQSLGRRQARRDRGSSRRVVAGIPTLREEDARLRISSVLSTVTPTDVERLRLIEEGLPNEKAGFYSDHIPVGAVFVSETIEETTVDDAHHQSSSTLSLRTRNKGRDGIQNRRENHTKSIALRRRHNKVLRSIAEWLLENGATDMIRDVPLYKWKWLTGNSSSTVRLTKKMRAPDLCCVLANTLLIIEVTVSQKDPDEMYQTKVGKYQDVFDALLDSNAVKDTGIHVSPATMAVVLNGEGQLCEKSKRDLRIIVGLIPDSDPEREVEQLAEIFEDAIL